MASSKPVIHGPDHLPGGADPIPLIGGYIHYEGDGTQWNTGVPSFDDNSGDYVVIQVVGPHVGDRFGAAIELVADASSNGGIAVLDFSGQGITLQVDGSTWPNGILTLEAVDSGSHGILLHSEGNPGDTGFTVTPGIRIETLGNNDILLNVPNGRQIQIADGTGQTAFPMTANVELYAGDSTHEGKVLMAAFDGSGNASAVEVGHTHFTGSGLDYYGAIVVLGAGNYFTITNHNGYPIFQVRNDSPPTYHVKTGTTGIIADL